MSDTDDTDDLLLIPPDFFLVDSDLESGQGEVPYYKVFDSIITHVNNLEKRLDHIESASDLSVGNNSLLDYLQTGSSMYNNIDGRSADQNDHRNLHNGIDSTQSTPQKPRTKFKLNSLPSSPNTPRYSPRKSRVNLFMPKVSSNRASGVQGIQNKPSSAQQDKANNPHTNTLLGEIDNFISNVKTIQRINSRSLSESSVPNATKRLDINDVSQLTSKLDLQEKECERQNLWACGDNVNTVPDYGSGMRNNIYNIHQQNSQPTVGELRTQNKVDVLSTDKGPPASEVSFKTTSEYADVSLSSSDSTQATAFHNYKAVDRQIYPEIHNNGLGVLDMQKNCSKQSSSLPVQEEFQCKDISPRKHRPKYWVDHDHNIPSMPDLHLLSLRELWNQRESSRSVRSDASSLSVKLEEEKLRRQHCEQLIKQLQSRTLELQERLAVALEVDQAKDEAIHRFHSAWETVAAKLQKLSSEKVLIEESIIRIQAENKEDLEQAAEKVAHYEKEASKALALAHNNHEKLAVLEKQYSDFQNQTQMLESQLKIVQDNYVTEAEKNKQFSEIIAQKEVELNENKNVLAQARKEVAQSKRAVEICQAEFTALKTECNHLRLQLVEEQQKLSDVESQKKKLLSDLNTLKKNEKNLQDEIGKHKEQMEQHKVELKTFYQDQVEQLVKEKLSEFQTQLDRAESAFQEELKNRELSIARTAAMHIQKISEKHNQEIQLLEERHREEVRLYQTQLSQNEQQIQCLQARFQKQEEKRSQIVQQLHKVMEAQWMEALKIINNNTKSPTLPNANDFSTIDQLNSLRSKSRTNLEELLTGNLKNDSEDAEIKIQDGTQNNGDILGSTSSIIEDDGRGYGTHFATYHNETPVSKKPQKNKKQMEAEIQKYTQLLLNKITMENGDTKDHTNQNSANRAAWIPALPEQEETKMSSKVCRDRKLGKPPWK